ncbi:hypothetical protein ACXYX3_27845 (plasmid) [Mycobacterium sp. C3-094]
MSTTVQLLAAEGATTSYSLGFAVGPLLVIGALVWAIVVFVRKARRPPTQLPVLPPQHPQYGWVPTNHPQPGWGPPPVPAPYPASFGPAPYGPPAPTPAHWAPPAHPPAAAPAPRTGGPRRHPATPAGVQIGTNECGGGLAIASLSDVIRSKQAANRPKDQRVLPTLRDLLANKSAPPQTR